MQRKKVINACFECHETYGINKKSLTIKSKFCGQIVRKAVTHMNELNTVFYYFCNIPELQAAYPLNYERKQMSHVQRLCKYILHYSVYNNI